MDKIKKEVWNTAIEVVKNLQSQADEIVLYSDAEKIFSENFDYYYKYVNDNFMHKNDDHEKKSNHLDRHKVAAIIICSILDAKIVGVSKQFIEECRDKEFLGNEKIAFEVALSFMYSDLKKCFNEGTVPYEAIFDKYIFPTPYSCSRSYGEVICRDLYFSNKHYTLNPLLLANLLFFIEEYSFTFNGIKRIS